MNATLSRLFFLRGVALMQKEYQKKRARHARVSQETVPIELPPLTHVKTTSAHWPY